MIVVFKENKVIAIDKKLLQALNVSLEEIDKVLSTLKLSLSALNHSNINIENKIFNIKEIDLLSVEDIKVYEVEIAKEKSEPKEELPPLGEDLLKTESKEELPPLGEDLLKTEPKEELPPLGEDLLKTEPKEELPPTEGGIQITFGDEFEEIRELLEMDEKATAKLFKEDLEKASQDLGIDLPTLEELSKELIKQIEESKSKFQKALSKADYELLHKTAHSLKGAALNLRLSNLALILKAIDEKSKAHADIEELKTLIDKFYELVEKIKPVIYKDSSTQYIDIEIPEEVKMLINKTIQRYLTSQNEKQLQKDLKYIQTILGVEIKSFEELKSLVKGQ